MQQEGWASRWVSGGWLQVRALLQGWGWLVDPEVGQGWQTRPALAA